MAEKKNEGHKIIAQNKKAWHEYFVEEKYEAGIALAGTEVKSVRAGTVNLKDSYCSFEKGEIFALGMHISPYEHGNIFNTDPMRKKKLLMHRREIMKLQGLVQQKCNLNTKFLHYHSRKMQEFRRTRTCKCNFCRFCRQIVSFWRYTR